MLSLSDLANPITYAYGRIYTQVSGAQESNRLVAISAEDGSILWSHDVSAFSSWTSYGAPTPVNGVVLFPGEVLTGLDAVTGERIYSLPSWGPVGWAASTIASEAYMYESGILKAVDPASGVLRWELPLTNEAAISSITTPVELPARAALNGNYPNPFKPVTTIEFALPQRSHVRLSVFDALGREVALLVDELHDGGTHHITFAADGLPSGVYFARLEAKGIVQTRALTLLK